MTDNCEFKSHEELGLDKPEWEALIRTLFLMEDGKIRHIRLEDFGATIPLQDDEFLFNMGQWNDHFTCGSVSCIGGTAEIVGKLHRDSLEKRANKLAEYDDSQDLNNLFFPPFTDYNHITDKESAAALRGYLTTGKTDWSHVKDR